MRTITIEITGHSFWDYWAVLSTPDGLKAVPLYLVSDAATEIADDVARCHYGQACVAVVRVGFSGINKVSREYTDSVAAKVLEAYKTEGGAS